MKKIMVIKKYSFTIPFNKLMMMSTKVNTKGYNCPGKAEILSLSTL